MIPYFDVEGEFLAYLQGWPEFAKYRPIFGRMATEKDADVRYACIFADGDGKRDVVSLLPRFRLILVSGWEGENIPGEKADMALDARKLAFWTANNPCGKKFSKVELLGGMIGPSYTKDNRIAFDGTIGLITS